MNKLNKVNMTEVNIPFAGFYESIWDDLLDRQIEEQIEYASSEYDFTDKELQEYSEHLWWETEFEPARCEIIREYADHFIQWFSDKLGVDVPYTGLDMVSPREYNFTTDRLFLSVPLKALKMALSDPGVQERLPDLVKERFTSRDGYSSFYSNDITNSEGEWGQPLEEWDANQWGTVIRALFGHRKDEEYCEGEYREFEWELYEHLAGNWYMDVKDPETWRSEQYLEGEQESELESRLMEILKPDVPVTVVQDMLAGVNQHTEYLEVPYIWSKSGQFEVLEVQHD